jgi:PAS domain S-box-containing protein
MKFPNLFQPRRTVPAPRDATLDFFAESLMLDHLDCDTEMSEGKKAAETQREILYQAMEQASESVVITDRTGSILYVNQGFVTASGYSREEALGQNPRVLKSGKQGPEFYAEMWKTLNAGATWTGRFINRRKDNSEYTEEAVISPVRDEGGNIRHFVAVKRDVTHELELAKQLRLAQRMETVGRLAGGIAHDFNNILTIILGNISYLEFTLPEDLPARNELAQISQAARRAADLTRQLLSFSRKQVIAPRQLDLNTLLEGLEKMLRRVLPENIRLEAVPHPQPLPVFADPGQIEQVVLNLALNARDAMPTGGTLRVSSGQARPETDPDTWFNDAPADPSREMAFIEVSDTGPGIPDEIRGKIFEPFFTTKEVGQGSGLGLSTAYGIAQQHRGSLSLRNAPQGACFALWLPLHAPQIPTPSTSPGALVMPSGQETLLMVEDEPMVLNIAARVLRGLGYQVLEAETARKALDTARNYEGPIHLLLTDVVMPEMSGMDLAKRFAMLRPDTPVLFASGYPREELDAQGLAQGELRLIQKPFNREELASAIRAVIDGKPLPLRSR